MRLYEVEFMRYTNVLKDTVSNWDGKSDALSSNIEYLHIGEEPFIIKECDIKKFSTFGGGYRKLTFVGDLRE